jgi:hypothetical protein
MKLPAEQLRNLLEESFSHDQLGRIRKAVEQLPPLTPQHRVAVYIVERVCDEVAPRVKPRVVSLKMSSNCPGREPHEAQR